MQTEYDKAIEKLLADFIPKDDNRSDKEHNKFINDILENMGITRDILANQLKIGVNEGVSIEEQVSRIEKKINDSKNINT